MTSKHTHALRNEVTLVWGSLRLAPINEPGGRANGIGIRLHVQLVIKFITAIFLELG